MAAATFDAALSRLLAHEGGYANHPSDPGGPTKYGITLGVYRQYVMPDATAADVKAMNVAEAKAIYRAKYWNALACDLLPAGVDYALFDYGVNSGTARAAKVVQRVVGAPAVDGVIGEATLALVRARDAKQLVAALCDERLAFLRRLKTWPVFGAGWARRVAEVRAAALALAAGAPADSGAPSTPTGGKGVVPVNRAAQKGTAGGVVATGGTAAQQAHEAGMRPAVIAAIVAVTIALALAAWLFWRRRQKRQQEAAVPRSRANAAALAAALLAIAMVWPARGNSAGDGEAKFRRDVAGLKNCATLEAIRARAGARQLTAYERRLKAELVPWYLAHCRRG